MKTHSEDACAELLGRLLPDHEELLEISAPEARERRAPKGTEQKTSAPGEPEREVLGLAGRALWDILSNNHTVIDRERSAYDFGSFRASAALIGETINRRYSVQHAPFDYLDVYFGNGPTSARCIVGSSFVSAKRAAIGSTPSRDCMSRTSKKKREGTSLTTTRAAPFRPSSSARHGSKSGRRSPRSWSERTERRSTKRGGCRCRRS